MTKEEVMAYILHTPENTNPPILMKMLDDLIADNSTSEDSSQSDQTSTLPTLYWYPETELDDIVDLPENPIPGSLLVAQEEKGGSGQELYYCYPQNEGGEVVNWSYVTTDANGFSSIHELFYGK